MTIKRLGFCCKWIDHPDQVDGIKAKDDCKKYNTGTTTLAWINRQHKDVAVDKLWTLMKENIEATRLLVDKVGQLHENLRLFRLSSDILPLYTEPNWSWFYKQPDVQAYAARHFGRIGDSARKNNVRLSMHPGQFCVLASDNPEIVRKSIEEFEYHADMARWIGFGKQFQDFKINVHISGRAGPEGFRQAYKKLSPEARNCITVENEEISYGLDDCLSLGNDIPIVLDIHHHFIREGEYIQVDDPRVSMVRDSWRGVRPVIHYSVSREEYLASNPSNRLPSLNALMESGYNKQQLRAHSDFYHNNAVNDWALEFWEISDMMCESKGKNLASFKLFEYYKSKKEKLYE